jgi:hypothetical protein
MKKFTIYFELFGKKMKTTVLSDTEENAKKQVKDKIIFHKIEKESEFIDHFIDHFMDILSGKKK